MGRLWTTCKYMTADMDGVYCSAGHGDNYGRCKAYVTNCCPHHESKEASASGVYECFHCGTRSVIWDVDFSFEDLDLEGSGIVHECHCENYGARITYQIDCGED